jgi:osmoprotectant transport system ATP-binding protein
VTRLKIALIIYWAGEGYIVVLDQDDTVAGIVTKTSVARSVAENLWGGDAK